MDYKLTGTFIESCDCYLLCPCWVNEDADDGHCTGLVAWRIDAGSTIGGLLLADRIVVCVTTHQQNRRGGVNSTVVFVDQDASGPEVALLAKAFSGTLVPGALDPLAGLAEVSGQVLTTDRAEITMNGPDPGNTDWSVLVRWPADAPATTVIDTAGAARFFDDAPDPMTVHSAALAEEFGVPAGDPVTTNKSTHLTVAAAALPGGYLEVTGRSAMTGRFDYEFDEPEPRERDDPDAEPEPDR